ncbi:MAG TPA: C1 family peptidase [Spirillospora sp.]|nr:C1 family peptidase [Spirillospora sp.]
MTEPNDPQPEPIANANGWASTATLIIGAVLAILEAFGIITPEDGSNLGPVLATAAVAVAAVVAHVLATVHARKRSTPLARPRDAKGRRLEPVGKHAAPEWSHGWYDRGGVLPPAMSVVRNDTGEPIKFDSREEVLRIADRIAKKDADLLARLDDTQEIPRVTAPVVQRIPEQVIPGRRLGRHVRHDPRSLSYLIPETTTPTTAMWQRRVPVFDQGDTGSCTGNAAAGVLGTSPFYETLPAGLVDDEGEAVKLYSAATALDDYPGTYPPDDTGSDGLSVAKACQQAGLISGYQHITSVAAAQTAIKTGPFIVGVNWYSSMDNPDANGLVKVSGQIRGGHEFECHGYDAQADLWWFTNSWGDSWGKDGTFCMSSASFARLLSEQGDATVFLPIAAPFPPSPEPPVPAPGPDPAPTGFPLAAYEAFRQHHYSRPKAVEFMKECDAWLNGG